MEFTMIVINNIEDIKKLKLQNTVAALGKFDGVHRGHCKIMEKLCEEKANGYTSLVFTFSGNPMYKDNPDKDKKLFTKEEQLLVYERLGIDVLLIYPIESGILKMEPDKFVTEMLVGQLGVKKIVCGENFRFGKNRTGDTSMLKELGQKYGYDTEIVELIQSEGIIISSTAIKELIKKASIVSANELLGYRYKIVGRVVHGNAIGRKIGTPTANIIPDENKILPPNGVYLTLCNIDGRMYKGITNIGCKPTINEVKKTVGVETYFLDFTGNLYDKILEIEFVSFVRNEQKFSNLSELKQQLEHDKRLCELSRVDK